MKETTINNPTNNTYYTMYSVYMASWQLWHPMLYHIRTTIAELVSYIQMLTMHICDAYMKKQPRDLCIWKQLRYGEWEGAYALQSYGLESSRIVLSDSYAPNPNSSGNWVLVTPILHTLTTMAKSPSNLTLPSWLSYTEGPPTLTNSLSPHMYLNSLLFKKKKRLRATLH